MLKLQTVKLHNQGATYEQFTFKNDPHQRVGYCRFNENSRLVNVYEIIFINTVERFDIVDGCFIRTIEDKVAIEAVSEEVYNRMLKSMDIIHGQVQIQLRKYEEEVCEVQRPKSNKQSKEESYWDKRREYINSSINPTTLDVADPFESEALSQEEQFKIMELHGKINELIMTNDTKTDLYSEVMMIQKSILQVLRGKL